ncbi:MAG: hypothetical protein KF799_10350 [Bdellovibrionales bacterium]|nr:hypothetical protein [Bdellovibrionales bacterium]
MRATPDAGHTGCGPLDAGHWVRGVHPDMCAAHPDAAGKWARDLERSHLTK